MLEQFNPEPDDTAELPATRSSRPIALIVTAAVLGVAILVGAGFLAFGNLGSGGGGGGIQTPGLLPAVTPGPSAPGAAQAGGPSSPTTTPVAVTTPSSTGTPGTPPADVMIANASMQPTSYVGTNCPGTTTGTATVTANGPVTITYRWASAQLATNGGTSTYRFGAAGSHQFTHAFTNVKTPNGHLTASFVVVTPVSHRASMVYTQKCGASVSQVTAMTPVASAGMPCSTQFSATLRAGVGPMTVRYHWMFKGAAPADATSGVWYVPRGGGRKTVTSNPVSHQQPLTAILVVDSPVRGQSSPTTASCL